MSEHMNVSLIEIQTQWSINDLADAHEMISWRNACIAEERRKQEIAAGGR